MCEFWTQNIVVVPNGKNLLGTKMKLFGSDGQGYAITVSPYHKTATGQDSMSWD